MRAHDIPITPAAFIFLEWIPELVLVPILQRALNTKYAELVITRPAIAACSEMRHVAQELRSLARLTRIPTPTMDYLNGSAFAEQPTEA